MSLHGLFDRNATIHPNRMAVEGLQSKFSYSELKDQSDLIASFLVTEASSTLGAVGLLIARHPMSIAGILGILKSHSKVVFFDEAYSPELVDRICEENGIKLILTATGRRESLGTSRIRTLDLLEDVRWRFCPVQKEDLAQETDPEEIAIVGYTSGTTGEPKGVAVSHRACLYAYQKFWDEIPEGIEADRFGYVTYFAWDALSPLTSGKTGVFVDGTSEDDATVLVKSLGQQKINQIFLTPTLLRALVAQVNSAEGEDQLRHLKVIWVGGEVLSTTLLRAAMDSFPNAIFINNYGPTECFVVSQGPLLRRQNSHIAAAGRVLPELRILLLDDEGNNVTSGGAGYLCVSGPALASGYVGRPDLNAMRFKKFEGEIYFLTGDFCSISADGELHVIGRSDFLGRSTEQQKISALEATLSEHPLVEAHKVVKNPFTLKGILVFVVPRRPDARRVLYDFINRAVPEASCVFVDDIPLHPASRKADFSRLFAIASSRSLSTATLEHSL